MAESFHAKNKGYSGGGRWLYGLACKEALRLIPGPKSKRVPCYLEIELNDATLVLALASALDLRWSMEDDSRVR